MQETTRQDREAYADVPRVYATVRAALSDARAERDYALYRPGQCHFSHAAGFYELRDGRHVEVELCPAQGGGVLLGVYRYRVYRRGADSRWRLL